MKHTFGELFGKVIRCEKCGKLHEVYSAKIDKPFTCIGCLMKEKENRKKR